MRAKSEWEFEKRLAAEFPFMSRDTEAELYRDDGCFTGPGWYEVLRGICLEITAAYAASGRPMNFTVSQVKEKAGGLCFYYYLDEQGMLAVRDPANRELHTTIDTIIAKWCEVSERTCEACGAPGVMWRDIGYVKTLCDSCHAVAKADGYGALPLPGWRRPDGQPNM
jgi:hypothetical protein